MIQPRLYRGNWKTKLATLYKSLAMSSKYKVSDSSIPHFVTFSVVGWIDVFTREQYKEHLRQREAWHYKYSSAIDYYTNEKGLLKIDRL